MADHQTNRLAAVLSEVRVPEAFAPIERRKVYELVAERLLEDISARRLTPGAALPTERQLAETLSVGRSSVREALRMLESRGLIASTGHGTFTVAEYGNPLNESLALLVEMRDGTLRELFEVRKILEVETAGLAAERRTDEDVERMRRAIEAMDRGMDSADRYIAGDLEFHQAVVAATGNNLARDVMMAIRDVMRRALLSIFRVPGSPESSAKQHRQIFEAVVAGDAAAARERMREHLVRVEADAHAAANADAGSRSADG
jgi:GntR family transcriptional regulator, transcriptional repressor for pyruvate dehydrogenase complex